MEQSGTVEKALDVLFHLHAAAAPQRLSSVGRSLDLPKSTTHRLLAALAGRGLVDQDEGGRYRPGIALIALGLGVLDHEPAVAAAGPVLEEHADSLGETIFLAAARAGRIVVLDKREGNGFLRAAPRVGDEIPVHATAIGKLYLAFAPKAVSVDTGLEVFTDHTVAEIGALERQVGEVRGRGWAENQEEWIPGLVGLAAPVMLRGRLLAAVAVAGPTSRISPARRDAFIRAVVGAAGAITARLEGETG